MREPRRLLEQDGTQAERALLRSARADGPPNGASQRMLSALEGLTAGSGTPDGSPAWGPPPSPASMAAPAMKLGALAKIGIAALIGAGAVGGGTLVHHFTRQQRPVGAASAPWSEQARTAAPAESPGSKQGESLATAPAESPPVPAKSEPGRRQPQAMVPDDSLSAELRLLDAARAAVDARNPTAARRALDSYAERFPQGRLKPEATVLGLAVLVRRGDRAAARALAEDLLASSTYRTYAPRITSLLREAER